MLLENNKKISLDRFINRVLYNKNKGYYMNKNPIGYKGDFITSPNISIMFSEMITIWLISFWEKMGCPKKINVVELGAGNGEMMFQILKTVERFNKFKSCSNFIIYEKSTFLKKIQKKKINFKNIKWINNLKKISNFPSIFIANEFFDALPIKQFEKKKKEWFEKFINLNNPKKAFIFDRKIDIKKIEKRIQLKISKNQNFIEYSETQLNYLKNIAKIIKKNKGGLLLIDYGFTNGKMKDTLQGISNHKFANILDNIGKVDITHNINFNLFKKYIDRLGDLKNNLTTQKNFLLNMGIKKRAEIITKNKNFLQKANIYYRVERLIDDRQMGHLFKFMLIKNKKNKFKLGF